MSDVVIRVENLSKRYRIRQGTRAHYETLYDQLAHALTPWRWFRSGNLRAQDDYIWALKDVSFEVKRGEVVGIIGRNGAGKSTLLKVLARITEPTEGYAEVRGRVGSLLEVGTGFHPELTGRENIYLNGAILGMRKAEIDRKFDEIVAFAEIEKFVDTPVKFYSSGMYVRLAFAVAAHLDPEILLVDEVLAVGDAAFQKKCLGKMGEVAGEGRTVLFVSHNMAAVQGLCQTGLLLGDGQLLVYGDITSVLDCYTQSLEKLDQATDGPNVRYGDRASARLVSIDLIQDDKGSVRYVHVGDKVLLRAIINLARPVRSLDIHFRFHNQLGSRVSSIHAKETGIIIDEPVYGLVECEIEIPKLTLLPGRYHVRLVICNRSEKIIDVPNALMFSILSSDYSGCGLVYQDRHGITLLPHRMSISLSTGKWEGNVLL